MGVMANETPVTTSTPEVTPVPESNPVCPEAANDERPAVRIMDDAVFQRCLEKVVTVHDRLLAELAK